MKVKTVFNVFLDFEGCWIFHLIGLTMGSPDPMVARHVEKYPYFFRDNKYSTFYGTREQFENEHHSHDACYDLQQGSHWGYVIEEMEVEP